MFLNVYGGRILGAEVFAGGALHGGPGEAFARAAVAAVATHPRFGDPSVPARADSAAGLHGGPGEAFARAAVAGVTTHPRLRDPSVPARADSAAGLHGGPGEAFARMSASTAPRLQDPSVPARANTDAGLHGGPGEAFARMSSSAVHSSAKCSRRPLVERFQAPAVIDTEVGRKRKRGPHLLPTAPCSPPPKLNLYGDNDGEERCARLAPVLSHTITF